MGGGSWPQKGRLHSPQTLTGFTRLWLGPGKSQRLTVASPAVRRGLEAQTPTWGQAAAGGLGGVAGTKPGWVGMKTRPLSQRCLHGPAAEPAGAC